MTIAKALKYLAPSFDPINRHRYEQVADRVDSLHPWERVRWSTLLLAQRDHLASVGIRIPTPDEAIAFFRSYDKWQHQLAALHGEWAMQVRDWPGGTDWGMALVCLHQWQSEISFYGELIEILSTGGVPTDKQISTCYSGFAMDLDLLNLSQLIIPMPSVLIPRMRSVRDVSTQLQPVVAISYERRALWVEFPYDEALVEKMRELAQELGLPKAFDGNSKRWRFPPRAIKSLVGLMPDAVLDSKAVELLQQERSRESSRSALFERAAALVQYQLPDGKTLFKHQQEGVIAMLQRPMIVADDMGLGKTIMSLTAAKACREALGNEAIVLVIAPASLRDNWHREAAMVGVEVEVHSWDKIPAAPDCHFIVIADEAHKAKSGTRSQRGRRFLQLVLDNRCVVCWPLTGTPMKNGQPIELLPLLQAIRHPLAQNTRKFEVEFCAACYCPVPGKPDKRYWNNQGAKNLDRLFRETAQSMLRRKKDDCLDLPPKTRVFHPVELSKAAMELYQAEFARLQAEHHARIESGEISGDPQAEALVELGQLRHAASLAKVEAAAEIAEEVVSQGHSIVLFTEFATSAERLALLLQTSKISVDLLTGDTPTSERQAIVDRFQSGQTQAFVGTIKAGGVGLTLTRSSTVVLVDRPWTPGDAIQAEDRCYRIGTTSNVLALWLQFGPIDERVDEVLAQKTERIELVLQGKRKTLRGIQNPKAIAKEIAADIFRKR